MSANTETTMSNDGQNPAAILAAAIRWARKARAKNKIFRGKEDQIFAQDNAALDSMLAREASLVAKCSALAERVKALETDAARWADIAERFEGSTTGRSERILEGLGYPIKTPWMPLGFIVDAARAEARKSSTPQGTPR